MCVPCLFGNRRPETVVQALYEIENKNANWRCQLELTTLAPQRYLAHSRRTLQYAHAYGPTVVLGVGAVSYEPGTPVALTTLLTKTVNF